MVPFEICPDVLRTQPALRDRATKEIAPFAPARYRRRVCVCMWVRVFRYSELLCRALPPSYTTNAEAPKYLTPLRGSLFRYKM